MERSYTSGWDAAEVYWGYLEKFCSPEKSITPSFLIIVARGLRDLYLGTKRLWTTLTEDGGAERQQEAGTLATLWSRLTHPGLPISGLTVNWEKPNLCSGGHCHKQLNDKRRETHTLPRWLTWKITRWVQFERLVILQSNLKQLIIHSLFS